jgi:P-type Mg2+ transporter
LLVLQQAVIEVCRVCENIIKYIKMAASFNFGNMFSVVGTIIFLPFLPKCCLISDEVSIVVKSFRLRL